MAGCASASSTGSHPATTPAAEKSSSAPKQPVAASSQAPVSAEHNPPGDIPDTTVYVAYRAQAIHAVIKVPEGWARQQTAAGVTFSSNLNSITIGAAPMKSAPTVATARSATVPSLGRAALAFRLRSVRLVRLTGGPAVEIVYQLNSQPNAVTGRQDVSPPGGAAPLLRAQELYRFFHAGDDETFALRGVSLQVNAGEMVAVVGPSGSGKSTLLACLAGLDEPDGGHVVVAGQRITRRPEAARAALRARWIGILLQSNNFIDHLSVTQNIHAAQALVKNGTPRQASTLLAEVGLADRAHARPSTLSGGESARAALAVALANDPPVLLADEPTGEVDRQAQSLVLDLLRGRAADRKAVLVVTHSRDVAAAADRIVHIVDGRVTDE